MINDKNCKKHYWFAAIIVAAFLLISSLGCDQKQEQLAKEHTPEQTKSVYISSSGSHVKIESVTYEDCEYVLTHKNSAVDLLHKQNCKFCLERNNAKTASRTNPE